MNKKNYFRKRDKTLSNFKMYKDGKKWLFASLAVTGTLLIGVKTANADDVSTFTIDSNRIKPISELMTNRATTQLSLVVNYVDGNGKSLADSSTIPFSSGTYPVFPTPPHIDGYALDINNSYVDGESFSQLLEIVRGYGYDVQTSDEVMPFLMSLIRFFY